MRDIDTTKALELAAIDLLLAVGQLVRKIRAETNSGELNLSQLSTLARLDRAGPMTTADLARAESMKAQSMGTILADLEQEGLVKRRPHPTDGRQMLIALTDAGLEARRRRGLAKREWLLAALSKLSSDEQQAVMSAVAIIKRLGDS